tara:strand:- start:332 stop:1144 length:813 start_codon:yes stop_codon:yes gene_type:complete
MFKKTILFPSKSGQKLVGVEKAPLILGNVINGIVNTVECSENLDNNLRNLYVENMKTLDPKLNIGGDHSMSIATVASSLRMNKNLKVLWIDAHGDINTRKSSNTNNYHGMPLGFLTKLDRRKFKFIVPRLEFNNLMYVGIRDLDSYEKSVVKRKKIKFITSSNLNNNPKESIEKIKKFINNDPLHLSFDVDALDPRYMRCTGTRYRNGLELKSTRQMLDELKKENIVNMDITEFNMELGSKKEQESSIYNYLKLFEEYIDFKEVQQISEV